ncbi:myotubularin-related protein 9-like [Tubulanus polymorphus]|uniref:myotubularin-related protein 9-like n=1 Tax=Tubulanus polymorphus TaxID=672921 RepID=UPI003DA464F9
MEFVEFIKTPKVDNVVMRRPFKPSVEGTLCITGHHLFLSSRQDHKEELWLLHKNVDCVEKRLQGSVGVLTLRCKDFTFLSLDIPSVEDCLNVASSIEQLSNIENINLSYPFFHRAGFEIIEDGWQAFTPESEFTRIISSTDEWRISHVNKDFEVCPSYPQAVVVPKSIDNETLKKVANFRHMGRFPVLSYYHKDNKTVILRSSQPLTGPNSRRCRDDEKLVNATLGIGKRGGYIIDTRAPSLAKVAQNKGGGVEPEAHYSQWRRLHQPIERFSVQQESLIKLLEACSDTNSGMDKWLSKLESCGWLNHVKDILTCACVVSQCIDKESASVLVHGSEGTDTTLQVTSLAQVILDPDCRTIRGFEALVEREWLQAGHMFSDRCAKSAFAVSRRRTEAPVYLLFLDCVWQLWQQFPCSFEFNEQFLTTLFHHSYSSQFGTFLCNSEAERKKHKLPEKTVSLWSFVNRPEVMSEYINSLYEPNLSVIWPSVAPQSIGVWTGLYQCCLIDPKHNLAKWAEITRIKEHEKEMKSKVVRLRRTLAALQREATNSALIPQN